MHRSCLRGDGDNTEYYEILGITTSANQDAIKKAYKKTSLSLHPDKLAQRGIEVTAEHKVQFQKVYIALNCFALYLLTTLYLFKT
jgi:DnaJ-class molecular chaperone